MRRRAKRVAVALVLLVLALAAPVLWIETTCVTPREPGTLTRAPLVADPTYARPEPDGYLSFPAWHVVYAYEDRAAVLRRGDESDVAYGRQIAGFWTSLCRLTRTVTARGAVSRDARVSLYTAGWRFSAKLAALAAYEKTLGRLFEWLRGPVKTAEDEFAARDLHAYAEFLRRAPWYEYPFGWRLLAFWRGTPWRGDGLPRKLERRVVLTGAYATNALAGALVGSAAAPPPDPAGLEIHAVVTGLDAADPDRDQNLKVVRALGDGRTLIRAPRLAYTDVVVGLVRRGGDVVEIAGNLHILMTVLAPPGPLPAVPGATPLFETAIQSRPDRRRVGLDVSVERLAAAIRALEPAGVTVERLY
jgi:hypothetical protein